MSDSNSDKNVDAPFNQNSDKVIAAEARTIKCQRGVRLGKDLTDISQDAGTVGLALSGGGIRSATFALGVIQALQRLQLHGKHKLLDCVDYLSTVSGGGYIGAWLAANRFRHGKLPSENDADKSPPEEADYASVHGSPSINHLRRYSRYLAPEAGITSADTWTMVTIWLRNTVLIQAMVFCVLVAALMLAGGWLPLFEWLSRATIPCTKHLRFWFETHIGDRPFPYVLVQFGLLWWAASMCRNELQQYVEDEKKPATKGAAGGQVKAQIIAVIITISAMIGASGLYWWAQCKADQAVGLTLEGWILSAMIAALGTWLVMHSRKSQEKARPILSRWRLAVGVFLVVTVTNVGMFHVAVKLMLWMKTLCVLKIVGTWPVGLPAAAVFGPFVLSLGYTAVLVLCLGMMSRRIHDKVREWWSRLGAWLLIYSILVLLATSAAIWAPLWMDYLGKWMGGWMRDSAVVAWLGATFASVFAGKSPKTGGGQQGGILAQITRFLPLIVVIGLVIGAAWFARWMLTEDHPPSEYGPFLFSTAGEVVTWQVSFLTWFYCFCGFTLAALILVKTVDINEFSMNQFYRNRLVRCYLGATKPGKDRVPHPFTGFDFRDDLPLSYLKGNWHDPADSENEVQNPGPYLLINTALNTASGGDLDAQERQAESFLLSPHFCGYQRRRAVKHERKEKQGTRSPEEPKLFLGDHASADETAHLSPLEPSRPDDGYCETSRWMVGTQTPNPIASEQFTLGTAVSISGAAASPNSGYHTSPLVAFLMTIFNARLGWWVPHPAQDQYWATAPTGFLSFFTYLVYELFGMATPGKPFVYLSDGGHFENLGVYELVRRRCRFIIAVDGEQDGNYTFHALGTAIRRCRVDFGAQIEINVEAIRPPAADKPSKAHCAVGHIRYDDGTQGTLLYIKSSLTGDEDTDISQYAHGEPLFPHESTADQFFSESQFESYRKLGVHAAESAFNGAIRWQEAVSFGKNKAETLTTNCKDPITHLMQDLCTYWYRTSSAPVSTFVNHAESLGRIWAALGGATTVPSQADLAVLPQFDKFVASLSSAKSKVPAGDARQLYYLAQQLIQLMENVYLDLDLLHEDAHPDNAGWMKLFRQWVQNDIVKQAWENSKDTYGTRFAAFWQLLALLPEPTPLAHPGIQTDKVRRDPNEPQVEDADNAAD